MQNWGGTEKPTLLWTNPSGATPTSFSAQTVSIDLSNYESVLIEVMGSYNAYDKSAISNHTTHYVTKSQSGIYIGGGYQRAYYLGAFRQITSISDTGITFGNGYGQATNQGVEDSCAIPLKIYGLKKALI